MVKKSDETVKKKTFASLSFTPFPSSNSIESIQKEHTLQEAMNTKGRK